MDNHIKKYTVLLIAFALCLMFSSCSSKLNEYMVGPDKSIEINHNVSNTESRTDLQVVSTINENVKESSTIEVEIEGLNLALQPYLDQFNSYYIGDEKAEYIKSNLVNKDNNSEPIPVDEWTEIVKILFLFGDDSSKLIKECITNFSKDGMIERQYAVSGLMKLLSLKYSISLDSDIDKLNRSKIISDLDGIDQPHQSNIRRAYCLGLTDFTVNSQCLFRPNDPLSRFEAASMLYHVFLNYGLPIQVASEEPVETPLDDSEHEKCDNNTVEAYSMEDIRKEYNEFTDALKKDKKGKSIYDMLILAEEIMDFSAGINSNVPVSLEQWQRILVEVFDIEQDMVEQCTPFDMGNILTYDIAAISIFKLSNYLGYGEPRDASEKELETALNELPQFEAARDTSKFAQMYSSGLLRGLYKMPGFTPLRPVSKSEAFLLIKRIIEAR